MNGVTEVYTYDDADKLLNIKVNGVVVKSFTYDMAGRTTGITDSGGTTTLSYDYEDRVVSISRPGVATNTFAYNGFGARVSKTDSAGSTTYLRNGTSVVAPVIADSGATYTPGVSERRGTESRFYHGDIKNFVEQTDSSGQIVSSQQYDAFGNPVPSGGGTWNGPFAYGGRFGYQTDGDYGLKLLGHRYYDPTTGRFLSRDPIREDRNWYAYTSNAPAAAADPDGLAWDYVTDVAGIGYDVYELATNPSWAALGWLVADIALLAVPFVPSRGSVKLGEAALAHADDLVRFAHRTTKKGKKSKDKHEEGVARQKREQRRAEERRQEERREKAKKPGDLPKGYDRRKDPAYKRPGPKRSSAEGGLGRTSFPMI